MAAPVLPGDQFRVGDVEPLFPLDLGPESSTFDNARRYAVGPDNQRFLVTRPVGEPDVGSEVVVVIENFLEELRQRVPN